MPSGRDLDGGVSSSRRSRGLAISLFAAFAFGLYPAAAQMAYKEGANSTFVILATTFSRAAALSAFCFFRNLPILPRSGQWASAWTGGFFQSLSIFGIIGSLVFLPGPVTIVIIFSHTILLLFFLGLKGEEKLGPFVLAVTALALFGLSLVVDVWNHLERVDYRGVGLAFLAALATMSRLYVFGRQTLEDHPAVVGARVFSFAFLFTLLLPAFFAVELPTNAAGYSWTALCCLSLVVGTFAMFYGIALLGSFQFSLMVKLEPIFTALFSIVIMKQYLNFSQYGGIALVMGSLLVYQLGVSRSEAKQKEKSL